MQKTIRKLLFPVLLFLASCVPVYDAKTCTISPIAEEAALTSADIARLSPGGSIDASISTFSSGGQRYWILPSVKLA